MLKKFSVLKPDQSILNELAEEINNKTKPPGSLGRLEDIATQIGLIQGTTTPKLKKPTIVIFAADHGLAKEGVSPYPQEVTYQMVMNFLHGGAAINAFCEENQLDLKIVDSGVNYDFEGAEGMIHAKVGFGTKNILQEEAMTDQELESAIEHGASIVSNLSEQGCNVIGFGEMGIGNTAVSSLLISKLLNLPIENCVGRGASGNDDHVKKKKDLLKKASQVHNTSDAVSILKAYGGFEIAMMIGAILQAAENKMLILIDGFIVTTSLLFAKTLYKEVINYCIFSHLSGEKAHEMIVNYLGGKPILSLGMRLGEGTGAALAYPIVSASVKFLNDMASFEEAGVKNKS
ncbi:MAG TPA: nicotinate-nucleotide--dimethylbenzimidazole phosphoribosyltransferase [Leptospiraceae bacterium]|nr:nicotinate-nucleotide--dimethylbenzimidazole phosphoribosyltransferase [Leptospiraceae bacterium]HMW07833.1 nicotinate-nucleotide--dimethylbenzimidazole phosphoribosyltransferase [Leptospiraceae bacterium]HMX34819.1 nicotinate-nucleotide--dimethylbenzimidazole phosphoribosyltransferase [Leptospiraceae bacterium]HMY33481.1 nicotinate-nucleotide--dimethylbenzimidazole phosphoribosyltransferase [Leptospiraceae bacterium]HMZ65651.1 nicotinate-nucleotide--dimethylbenzimidazole phosphoribosyltrans